VPVERDETSFPRDCQTKQIDIGQMLWRGYVIEVENSGIGDRQVVRPKLMIRAGEIFGQKHPCLRRTYPRVRRNLCGNTNKSVLRQRAGRPSTREMPIAPMVSTLVVNMVGLKQCNQKIDIEQRTQT
jgi:hypothetical protein